MKHKRIYLVLLLLLVLFAGIRSRFFFSKTAVVKGETPAYWHPDWYRLLAEETNRTGIRLELDGEREQAKAWEKRCQSRAVRMSEQGSFLIALPLLSEEFTCFVALLDEDRLFLERGNVQAEVSGTQLKLFSGLERSSGTMGRALSESAVLLPKKTFLLSCKMERWEGELYVPFEVLEQAFGFRGEWKPEEQLLRVSSGETQPALPERYDYRERQRAPRVKNQGNLGTCWAFASSMALESSLLPEKQMSFSEDHMSLRNSFHLKQNDGGDFTMSMAYLLAWQGPVLEAQDPYGDGYSPSDLKPACHVQEILVLPEKNQEEIKRAVFLYGGVQSSLYTSLAEGQEEDRYYKKENSAYYCRKKEKPNHDVVIIGWDDHYPKENFSQMPEEDGAFICANSWGGEFGEDGYFYVSYFDSNIGINNILYSRTEAVNNYDAVYQTDLCGWVGQLGYGKDNAYFANVYTAKSQEELCAVGFYATGSDTSYEIFTVTDAAGSAQFGRRRLAASGQVKYAGFYTILLDRTIHLEKGERFAVIVRITTPDSVHPVAIEYNSPDKDLIADLEDGEGYISFRGTSWERVEENQNANVCLKAYTRKEKQE